jgi:uncharacterized protein (TIGR02217 family)
MAFIDQRLPTKVELNAVRHDDEDIEIVTTDGGWETRNARQASSLRSWDISFPAGFYDDATIAAVIAMYKAARGKLHSFRFKDPVENAVADAQFGIGDGATTTFPLIIPYTAGSETFERAITRPISPIIIKKDGVVAGSGYSVNYATGVVTFSPAPSVGVVLSWSGAYDVPVRFDSALEMTALTIRLAHVETLTIKEVRE